MPYLWAETFGGQRMSDRGSTNYCALCEERAVKIEALQAENEKLRRVITALFTWYPNEVDAAMEAEGLEIG